MHDLNTINRINYEAFAESIQKYRAAGRFVLVKYEGSHLVGIETFGDQHSAGLAFDSAAAALHGGERNVLFTPIVERKPDFTLADYIARKSDGATGGAPVLPSNEN